MNQPNPTTASPKSTIPEESLRVEGYAERVTEIYGKLWAIATAMIGDRVEAEDLIQEAVLVGLRKYPEFEVGTNFAAWMSQIVRYQASNWRSKAARQKTQAADPQVMEQTEHIFDEPSDDASKELSILDAVKGSLSSVKEQFDQEVLAAIKEVTEIPRACLLLRIVHEMSYEEIGEMLDIPKGTAMSHVHRTRTKLREKLSAGVIQ